MTVELAVIELDDKPHNYKKKRQTNHNLTINFHQTIEQKDLKLDDKLDKVISRMSPKSV